MDKFIQTCAANVLKNRAHAEDKSHDYRTRLMYDRCSANWENAVIMQACIIIYHLEKEHARSQTIQTR